MERRRSRRAGLASGPLSRRERARHLKGLTKLRGLGLAKTKVTDAGLEHLKGLTNLQSLILGGTNVTDVGLEHLKGLTNLQLLELSVTDELDWSISKV